MDESALGAIALFGLLVIAVGQLVVLWRAFGVWDAAKKGERFWQAQAARSDNAARQFRDQLLTVTADGELPRPSRASRPLRVYDDTAKARERFERPIFRTEDLRHMAEDLDPVRTQAEPAVPPIAEDTTRELRPALKLLTSRNRP